MEKINANLKELSKRIRLKRRDIKERCDSITKFVRKKIDASFDDLPIGSYAIKTTVKQKDNQYDIDMALTFSNLSDDEVIKQKQKVYDALKEYNDGIKDDPIIKFKDYAVTIDFVSSKSNSKYHFDYTIYKNKDSVVKGKQHVEKKLEKSGNISFVESIKKLENDSKEHFHVTTRLVKHCVKNGKFKSSLNIPSIVITSVAKDNIVSNWDGSDDFLETIIEILDEIKTNMDDFSLPFAPYDNPFDRLSSQQISVNENKLEEIVEILEQANNETDSIEKWNLIKDLFPGLEKPKKGDGSGEKSSITRTSRSQGA